MVYMQEVVSGINENMEKELNGMEAAADAEFRAFQDDAKADLEAVFYGCGIENPTESDYRFAKILFDKMIGDLDKAFPNGRPKISGWSVRKITDGIIQRYIQILEKNLTTEFVEKYNLKGKKPGAILAYISGRVAGELLDKDEEYVEGMDSEDEEVRKTAKFEAFMRRAKEPLESTFNLHKLGQPTVPDYLLLQAVTDIIATDLAESAVSKGCLKVRIPRTHARGVIKKSRVHFTNFFKESIAPESKKEHNFTNKKIAALVECATNLVLKPLVIDDEECDKIMMEAMSKEIQSRDISMMCR